MQISPPELSSSRIARSVADVRAWLVGEIARALNVASASVDSAAPLDSHGVDSLGAIGMAGGLAEFLGRDVPATLMWDYPTVDALAAALADADAPRAVTPRGVLPFQPLGDRPPLFCFPGIGGHPVTFAGLAKELGAAQPCYGLSVAALDGGSEPLDTVESIAAEMVANIRRLQPHGPYQLAGYSFGGYLAHEAARQLTAAGEHVATLAIYDAFAPNGRLPRPRWQRLPLHAWLLTTRRGRRAYLRERLGKLAAAAFDLFEEPPVDDGSPEAAVRAVRDANLHAVRCYAPRAYPGTATFFVARERPVWSAFFRLDPAGGWRDWCVAGVRVVTLSGTHLTIFKGDHVRASADALRPYLLGAPTSAAIAA